MISINEYTDTLINAKRYEIMNENNIPDYIDKIKNSTKHGLTHDQLNKMGIKTATVLGKDIDDRNTYNKRIHSIIKNNNIKSGLIGTAVGAGAVTAGVLAKKIYDKKKAAKEKEEVKENYEYPEYAELVEAVVNSFTEEELMQENASEFACEVADYMIENC